MIDMTRALLERGIRVASASDGQHRTTCPECSAKRKKVRDACLSVQISAGGQNAAWHCHHCQWEGGIGGDRDMIPRRSFAKPRPVKASGDVSAKAEMLAWFAGRGIGEDTINEFGVVVAHHCFPQLNVEQRCIAFPYRHGGVLTNVKYRATVISEDGTHGKTFAQEKDCEPTLFNADEIQADELIIVEGEMDVMACWEAGLRSVVSLPNGAAKTVDANGKRLAALEAHADKLLNVKRVVIATDADGPGLALAEALALRFGKDRCWRVAWPDGIKDANDLLMRDGKEAVALAIGSAQPWPMDGVYRAGHFAGAVEDLYYGRLARPLSCGLPGLDNLWRIVPGTFNVVTGIPNHGKSALLDQIAVAMAQKYDWKFAFFSPENAPERHIARLAEKLMGMPFDDGPNARMTIGDVRIAIDWVDRRFAFVRPGEAQPTVDWLLDRFRWCSIRCGVNAIVIDPYNEIEASRPREQTETEFVSTLISKLKRFAQAHGATVFMVVHPTKLKREDGGAEPIPSLYDLAGSAHWRNKADTGIVVHRDFAAGTTRVFVKKVRDQPVSGSIGSASFVFDPVARRLVSDDKYSKNIGAI